MPSTKKIDEEEQKYLDSLAKEDQKQDKNESTSNRYSIVSTDSDTPALDKTEKIENTETPKAPTPGKKLPFTDIEDSPFLKSIEYVFEKGIMIGTSEDKFSPKLQLSRATVITILHKVDKEEPNSKHSFEDVATGIWYEKALSWASEHGIVQGTGNNQFSPENLMTVQEFSIVLQNYAKYKGHAVTKTDKAVQFTDYSEASVWAQDALHFMVDSALIAYKDETSKLNPKSILTREETAALIHKFLETFQKNK